VEVLLNGTPVRALVDSGAQYSVVDRALVDRLGLGEGSAVREAVQEAVGEGLGVAV
jgi:predicted aspartyl protease